MKIVIEGAGEVGCHLAKMLREESNSVVVIDDDAARLDRLTSNVDVDTVQGNPSSVRIQKEAGVDKADLYIAVYPYAPQEFNLVGAILAKRLGAAKVIARINDEEYLSAENKLLFKEMGIELMFYPEKNAADEIVDQLKYAMAAETLDFARGKLQISVFKIDENSPILDLKLSEFMAMLKPGEADEFRILAVNRDDKTIIPGASTKFLFGDLIYAVARKDGVRDLAAYLGKSSIQVKSVMIFGGGAIGAMVASTLSRHGVMVKIIEKDKERCIELTESLPDEVIISCGDGRNSDFLYEEGIARYDAFLALTPGDETNVLSCVVAKKFGVPRTIAEVENIEYIRLAEEMGVDSVINKKLIMAGRIFKFTLSGRARFVKYMNDSRAEVIEYTVAPGSAVTRVPVKELGFPQGAIIAGIIRGSDAIIAVGDTLIEAYDRVAVFALPQSVAEVDRLFK